MVTHAATGRTYLRGADGRLRSSGKKPVSLRERCAAKSGADQEAMRAPFGPCNCSVFVFLHLRKCAGTAVRSVFQRAGEKGMPAQWRSASEFGLTGLEQVIGAWRETPKTGMAKLLARAAEKKRYLAKMDATATSNGETPPSGRRRRLAAKLPLPSSKKVGTLGPFAEHSHWYIEIHGRPAIGNFLRDVARLKQLPALSGCQVVTAAMLREPTAMVRSEFDYFIGEAEKKERSFVEYARSKPELLLLGGVGQPGSLPPTTPTTQAIARALDAAATSPDKAATAASNLARYLEGRQAGTAVMETSTTPPLPGKAHGRPGPGPGAPLPRSSSIGSMGYEFLGLHPLLGVRSWGEADGGSVRGGGSGTGGGGGGGGGGGATNGSSLETVEQAVDTYRVLRAANEDTLALLDARAAWVAELKAARLLRCGPLLTHATAMLSQLDLVGTAEKFDESMLLLSDMVGLRRYPFAQINDNQAKASRNRSQPRRSHAADKQQGSDRTEQEELEQLNECSILLWREWSKRLDDTVAAQPPEFARRLAGMKEAGQRARTCLRPALAARGPPLGNRTFDGQIRPSIRPNLTHPVLARFRAARAASHVSRVGKGGPAAELPSARRARNAREFYARRREAAREFCAQEGLDLSEDRIHPHCLQAVVVSDDE